MQPAGVKRRKEKKMKYRIEEVDKNGRFYYDDEYDTVEEALEVVREYQNEDEGEPDRKGVIYCIVDENGEVVDDEWHL